MKRTIVKSSLRHQVIWTSLLCLIFPLAIVLWAGYLNTNALMKAQATDNASESLKLIESQLTNIVEGLLSVANNIEFDSSVTPYLKSKTYSNPETSMTMITDKLLNLTHDKQGVYVSVLTTDDRFFTNYSLYTFSPRMLKQYPWFKNLNDLTAYETYVVGLHPNYLGNDTERDPNLITFARTFRTTQRIYAYCIISITEDRIRSLFENYNEQDIMLVDSGGYVLSGERPGTRFELFGQLKASSGEPVVEIDGKPYIYVLDELPFNDWTLVGLMPYDKATEGINRIYFANFFWQISFILIFVVILVLLLRRFMSPVVKLGKVASSIESGNLSVRSGVRGSNEIGMLGRSFDQMLDRIEDMVEQIGRQQELARKAELSMLQAQISPHFLFNILNSIRLRIQLRGDRDNANLISTLSRLLRMTIQRQDKRVMLSEEISIAIGYMDLMKSVMKEPFQYEIALAPETEKMLVPRSTLQPVIENALNHGLHTGSGMIRIESALQLNWLVITVRDNGAGMTEEALKALLNRLEHGRSEPDEKPSGGMSGIGLSNVYDRLNMLYGPRAAISIESGPGAGTSVHIRIPRSGGDDHD